MPSSRSMKAALNKVRKEEEERGAYYEMRRLRKLLALALCDRCGEEIGEENGPDEPVATDDEKLAHRRCVEPQ